MIEVSMENIASLFHAETATQGDIVDAITSWCEALYGSVPLQSALANLVRNLGAEAGTLVRTYKNENRPIRIASFDALDNVAVLPLDRSFADSYFGKHLENPRPATVWLGTTFAEFASDPVDPALETWQKSRHLQEFAVLVLASGSVTRDHIELHFRKPLAPESLATLNSILPAVARTWATRQVGLITRTVVNHHDSFQSQRATKKSVSLLASSNPAKLSRAEFRVCLLLSRGLSIANTVAELGVTDATVRTHLRNIYAKSHTSSIAELIFCLIAPQQTEAERRLRRA